jgi:hypothetical protein
MPVPPKTPKKSKPREARTAQTGMYDELDYPGKGYITPKKGVSDDENYDAENLVSVEAKPPTEEEGEIAARQERFRKGIITAKGGKKRRRSLKKTKKVKKHRKQK